MRVIARSMAATVSVVCGCGSRGGPGSDPGGQTEGVTEGVAEGVTDSVSEAGGSDEVLDLLAHVKMNTATPTTEVYRAAGVEYMGITWDEITIYRTHDGPKFAVPYFADPTKSVMTYGDRMRVLGKQAGTPDVVCIRWADHLLWDPEVALDNGVAWLWNENANYGNNYKPSSDTCALPDGQSSHAMVWRLIPKPAQYDVIVWHDSDLSRRPAAYGTKICGAAPCGEGNNYDTATACEPAKDTGYSQGTRLAVMKQRMTVWAHCGSPDIYGTEQDVYSLAGCHLEVEWNGNEVADQWCREWKEGVDPQATKLERIDGGVHHYVDVAGCPMVGVAPSASPDSPIAWFTEQLIPPPPQATAIPAGTCLLAGE